jgi:outer membrane lipoprotein SlyB
MFFDREADNERGPKMSTTRRPKSTDAKASARRHEHEAEGGVAGALAGAALGGVGGPPGAVAGAVIGGVVGAVAAGVAEINSADRAAVEDELDEEAGASNERRVVPTRRVQSTRTPSAIRKT